MIANEIMLGVIDSVEDDELNIIKFSVAGVVNGGKAKPAYIEKRPVVGDKILLYRLASPNNTLWYYLPLDSQGKFTLHLGGAEIILTDGKITLTNDKGKSLYDILAALLEAFTQNSPTTQGSPAAQNFNPGIVQAIIQAKTDLGNLMQ
jgi:hypothetical protein